MPFSLSIRSRLFLTVAAIFTFSFLIFFIFTANLLDEKIEQEVQSDLNADLKYIHSQFYARPLTVKYSLLNPASSPAIHDIIRTRNIPRLKEAVERWRQNMSFVDLVLVLDERSQVLLTGSGSSAEAAIHFAGITRRVMEEKQPVIATELVAENLMDETDLSSNPAAGESGQALIMTVAVPVIDKQGKVLATLLLGDILNRDRQILYSVPRIFDTELEISLTQGNQRIASSVESRDAGLISHEILKAVEHGTFIGDTIIAGIPSKVAVEALRNAQGKVVGTLSVALVRDTYVRARYENLVNVGIAGGIGFILSSLMAFIAARTLTGPLDRLCTAARKVQEGDLDYRTNMNQSDEFGRLGSSFDLMTASLKERELTINRKTIELEEMNNLLGQKVAERTAQLATEMGRLEAILTSMADGVVSVDWTNRVVLYNPAAQRMLGLAPGSILGRRLDDLADYVEMRVLLEYINDIREAAGIAQTERTMTVGTRSLHLHISRLSDQESRFSDVVISFRDVTAEEEMKRIKNNLIITLSHEFKTPLTSMKGALELLLKRQNLGDTERDLLDVGLRNTKRLHGIVGELLHLARKGTTAAHRQPLEVKMLVNDALQDVVSAVETEMRIHITPDLPLIFGEREKLTQVLVNLMANAAISSTRGGHVSLHAHQEGEYVQFSINGGVGVPGSARWDGALGHTSLGTGLGMVFCKEIIESHSGRITFCAGEYGSEVIFTVPAYEVP